MLKKIILLIVLIEGLLNCTSKVGQQLPVPPKTFPSSTKDYEQLSDLPYLAWWQQFNDIQLDYLIEAGLKNNTDIHIAIGNLQQAQGELLQIKLSWIPTIKLLGGYSTNPGLGAPAGFYGVWPYYVINIMQLYTQQKQANYNVKYYQAAIEGVRLALIGQIAASYFTLMAQLEQLKLLKQFDGDLKELTVLAKQDIKIGLANEIDLAQLQSDEQLIAAQIKPILHNITASENALRYLINENPGQVANKNNFAKINFSQFKPGSLPASVLNNRPDMKMAKYALQAKKMGILIAYSEFFPAAQLDELVGAIQSPKSGFAQFTDAYLNASLAPSTLGDITASKGAYHAALAELIKTIRRILKEVDNDYSANRRMEEQFRTYVHAEDDYRHKYQLQQGLLKIGLISYKELLQSKISLDNLALATNQAKLELAMSLVTLYQDLAGGYAYKTEAQPNKKMQTERSK